MTSLDKPHYSILPEVAQAIKNGEPVVALESTVITHGLPYPENVELAGELEKVIRECGGIPATIAILEGTIHVGLDHGLLKQLVDTQALQKVSVRDMAPVIRGHLSGGTTVAGTLAIAQAVGIRVFATGGIGGVHRGNPFDVSADLMQLARCPLVVVCAGAKAILDIEATLEVLESYSVPVVGYQTDEFPAFYSTSSGVRLSVRADSGREVAEVAKTHWELGLESSILVAVPPPPEVALRREVVEEAVRKGMDEVKQKHIHGQAVTPYLLRRVSELTGGLSLQANLGLLRNNARVAAEIAQRIYQQ